MKTIIAIYGFEMDGSNISNYWPIGFANDPLQAQSILKEYLSEAYPQDEWLYNYNSYGEQVVVRANPNVRTPQTFKLRMTNVLVPDNWFGEK
jgi:hypothetical protein